MTKEKVTLRLVEFHVVHHCNLTCEGCSHFSPTSPKYLLTLEELQRDVLLAAQSLQPSYVHILGGEPLLNPQLAEFIPVFRQAFPLAIIKLVTNGVLLPRSPDALFQALATHQVKLSVSNYPSVRIRKDELEDLCLRFGSKIEFWEQNTFLDFFDPTGSSDPQEARAACPMDDACNVRDGRLFPCPVTAWADLGGLTWQAEDGVSLQATPAQIRSVLDRTRVTSCCRFCRLKPIRVPHRMGARTRSHVAGEQNA